jgi:ATPase subunit of ABC transporter with duplicated ATPase domains
MPFLRSHALAFAFSDARALFSSLSFQLEPGFTALVGENGAGKTTLLRVLAGGLSPTAGHVQTDCATRVLLSQQSPEAAPPLEALIAEPAFHRLLGQLGLDLDQLERWPTLSFGERKRWQIAVALAAEPEVLLLDEPSNHLDAAGRAWLVAALNRFRGVGVVVSHDRALLDAVCQRTLMLSGATSKLWRGNYSHAREAWEQERLEREDEKHRLQRERDRAAEKLNEARRSHAAAEHARSNARADRHDSDARTMGRKNVIASAAAKQGRRVEVLRRAHERAVESERAVEMSKAVGRDALWLGHEPSQRPVLLELDGRVVGRSDRIRIAGANGAGKTTLLRRLLAGSTLPPERTVYLPQETTLEDGQAVLRELLALDRAGEGAAFALVAALGLDPEHARVSEAPSPGEVRKLLLGLALARRAWLLVLDEPTNHLDLPSIERLETVLEGWPGGLLLVTHDDALAARCTTQVWNL